MRRASRHARANGELPAFIPFALALFIA